MQGMIVPHGATVDAIQNYWGDPTDPYHASLNPEGQGNPVNGDGDDLVFTHYLSQPYSCTICPPK